MGNFKPLSVQYKVVIEKEVQINQAGAIPKIFYPAKFFFNLFQKIWLIVGMLLKDWQQIWQKNK